MSAVYVHNITVDSGTDYEQEYDLYEVGGKVVDLANHTARAQIRKHRGSSCLLYTSPSPRDTERSRMPSSA